MGRVREDQNNEQSRLGFGNRFGNQKGEALFGVQGNVGTTEKGICVLQCDRQYTR